MIDYVKKFEGHKPGPEKRLENDPTIFRYRTSFLIAVDTLQKFYVFCFFKYIFVELPRKVLVRTCYLHREAAAAATAAAAVVI